MISLTNPTVTIDEKTYEAELAKVERTNMGFRHGIFTAYLSFTGPTGNWGQSQEAPCLSYRPADAEHHIGWAGGTDYLIRICEVFGTDWEEIAGTLVYVLRNRTNGSKIEGIMNHLKNDHYLLFKPLSNELLLKHGS